MFPTTIGAKLVAVFPLATHPPVPVPELSKPFPGPTLWIHPPASPDTPLSADVECLKWQAYLALRRVGTLHVRTDISSAGALDSRLPNLQTDRTTLLPAHLIPTWADERTVPDTDPLEGYADESARDESRAWVTLLERTVHAALLVAAPAPSYLASLLDLAPKPAGPLPALLTPPPAPLTGFSSLFPPSGSRIPHATVYAHYRDAISALSDRLATDKWFLASA